ncbi:MAG: gamma-glutamyltransferase [Rhodospirillaceae bacterium]
MIALNKILPNLIWLISATFLGGCANSPVFDLTEKKSVYAKNHMVSAANPHATQAGLDILRAGGSAVDAAIAVQMVLTLVEPQASGIGGGGFLLHFKPRTDHTSSLLSAYDGRETAPSGTTETLFLREDGKPLSWDERKIGGKSVGVPGIIRMLALAHKDHGRLPWKKLFEPAIRLAREGFRVSPRLNKMIRRDKFLANFPNAANFYYLPGGTPLPVGHLLKNLQLGNTLSRVANEGPEAFYIGDIPEAISREVRETHHLPSQMKESDIKDYKAKRRSILCLPYRSWNICGMPPPTSGGITTIQILKLLERFDLSQIAPGSAKAIHLISEASRLAFADRNQYLGDPDFLQIPVQGLLDESYLRRRALEISPFQAMGKAKPGNPVSEKRLSSLSSDEGDQRPDSTSHISIIDKYGEAISMTTSIGTAFGSRIMVKGFMLNDQLADFSPLPRDKSGTPKANRPGSKKRPRSSMAPTFVLDKEGRLVMAVGSPGGSSIIGYVVKTLVAALDWNLPMQAAIDLPNFINKNGRTELEKDTPITTFSETLESLGHKIHIRNKTSGLHGIRIGKGQLEGGADKRREGIVLGD